MQVEDNQRSNNNRGNSNSLSQQSSLGPNNTLQDQEDQQQVPFEPNAHPINSLNPVHIQSMVSQSPPQDNSNQQAQNQQQEQEQQENEQLHNQALLEQQESNNIVINKRIAVFESLLKNALFNLIISIIRLIITIIAFTLKSGCQNDLVISYILLGSILSGMALFLNGFLSLKMFLDRNEIIKNRERAFIIYTPYEMESTQNLSEAFQEKHFFYKYIKMLYLVLYLGIFVFGNIVVFQEHSSPDCPIGRSDTDFVWSVVIILLIFSYLSIGIPMLILILYMIALPFFFLFSNQNEIPNRNSRQAVQPEVFSKLKVEKFNTTTQLTEENLCIICLVEFQKGDQYIILPCSHLHVYHKDCIQTWLNQHETCPLCKKTVQ